MTSGFCLVCEDARASTWEQWLSHAHSHGLMLSSGTDTLPLLWTDQGEWQSVDVSTVHRQLEAGGKVGTNLWLDETHRLHCYLEQQRESRTVTIELEQLPHDVRIAEFAIDRFRRAAGQGMASILVVDRKGTTDSVMWQDYFEVGDFFPDTVPEILGIERDLAPRFVTRHASRVIDVVGERALLWTASNAWSSPDADRLRRRLRSTPP